MNRKYFLVLILFLGSCSARKNSQTKCYKNSRTHVRISWSEKLIVDNYIRLKKGNYFNYYQRIWGSEKLIGYRGSYLQLNDTLVFKFCGDSIPKLLTEKVLIDKSKNEIILLAKNPRLNKHFKISYDKRY